MEQLIDFHAPEVQAVLDTLLKDRSTGKNIIWATDPPEELQTVMYEPVTDKSPITAQQLGLTHYEVVLPRMMKQTDTQQQRTRKKGEVFSPAWVCNKMNNALDADWFGALGAEQTAGQFTVELPQGWQTVETPVQFPACGGKTPAWVQYVQSRRLEVTCGEAPFLASRYDAATGEMIPVARRIGILDRKLRVVSENAATEDEWCKYATHVYLKLTRHNGRAGAHGTYNPKHNDRSFNLANSEHIDPERAKGNIYWDCFHGFRSALAPPDPDDLAATFSEVERQFYETHYTAFVESQNERNAKIRHTERNRSIPDLLSSRKTCPEETIYQLGTLDEHASAEDLLNIVTEFIEAFKTKFGEHVHVLDWALHLDESTPHIHERHVFDCENKYGEVAPQQEKALEALGFNLPDPDKPLSRRNNRKITFDAACRKMLFEIAKRHGLELEEEAEYGNRKYLEKQDFILAKQKERLAAQQSKLDELTLKVSDMETLLENVSAAAYDKAVEVVTDVVRTETRKEDMRMIEDTKKWVLSPERKAPQATREYAAHRLDGVLDKFLKTMQTTTARLQEKLLKTEARQKGKEQVKEKARNSVLQLLNRLQAEQAQRNPSALSTAEKSENRFQ